MKRRSAINAPQHVTQLGHAIITCWHHPFTLHSSLLNCTKCVTSAHWVGEIDEGEILHLLIAWGRHIVMRDHIANTSRDQYKVRLDSLKDLSVPLMSPRLWLRWIISPMLWSELTMRIQFLLDSYIHGTISIWHPHLFSSIFSGSLSILSHPMITLWPSHTTLHPLSIKGHSPLLEKVRNTCILTLRGLLLYLLYFV